MTRIDDTFLISRPALMEAFGDMRVVQQFEDMQLRVAQSDASVTANVEATERLENAAFVTLSENVELTNERVLALGDGLSVDTSDPGLVRLSTSVYSSGGHEVQFSTVGETALVLPPTGTLATRNGTETLSNKTIDAPTLSGLGNYADDAAAAAGGVPVNGIYRDGSDLRIRVS